MISNGLTSLNDLDIEDIVKGKDTLLNETKRRERKEVVIHSKNEAKTVWSQNAEVASLQQTQLTSDTVVTMTRKELEVEQMHSELTLISNLFD